MGYISNFIVQSPFLFLGLLLILSTIFFIYSMYLLLKKPKQRPDTERYKTEENG